MRPSIWRGSYSSKNQYDAALAENLAMTSVFDFIDDRILYTRHPFQIRAFCSSCNAVTDMDFTWQYGASCASGSIHPAWTETGVCTTCHLNSRMRAVFSYIREKLDIARVKNVYIAEHETSFYSSLAECFPGFSLTGSEYFGPNYGAGEVVMSRSYKMVRNEDLTSLSFRGDSLDLVITQDVFEHIPDYRKAFSEIWRVLRKGGKLLFTVPFFHHMDKTQIRAVIEGDQLVHLLPPEIHGNPVSSDGALCFQNFGWDLLDELRMVGFSDVLASMYWAPWSGHLGLSFFVFSANKAIHIRE